METKTQCTVVGSGQSLKDFDFSSLKNKTTIVANRACEYVPNPDYFVTMDTIYPGKIIGKTKVFIVNLAHDYVKEIDGRIVDTRIKDYFYDLSPYDIIIKSRKQEGIGYTFNDFRTGNNSGFCAFQLAVLLGYKKIEVLGLDMTGSHFYSDDKKDRVEVKLSKFREHFQKVFKKLKGVEVER